MTVYLVTLSLPHALWVAACVVSFGLGMVACSYVRGAEDAP